MYFCNAFDRHNISSVGPAMQEDGPSAISGGGEGLHRYALQLPAAPSRHHHPHAVY